MSYIYNFGYGILSTNYTLAKGLYTIAQYSMTWFSPVVIFPSKEIELGSFPRNPLIKNDNNKDINPEDKYALVVYDPKIAKINALKYSEDISKALVIRKNSISYIPNIQVKMPSVSDISSRILMSMIIDLPLYTLKCFSIAPIPTIIALYAILPPEIWYTIAPKLFYYLPRLLL